VSTLLGGHIALRSFNCHWRHDSNGQLRSVVELEMGFVAWTIELLVGSPAERDFTRAPLNLSPKEAAAERPGRANATCGACVNKKTTEHGKTHYFPYCTMALGNGQCVAALPRGHEFYTGAKCSALKCPGKDPSLLRFSFCEQPTTRFRCLLLGCRMSHVLLVHADTS